MNKTLLALENVTCRFSPQAPAAVENLSLNLEEGELLSLLGPSGCGKTTLLRLIAGFEQPQQGRIAIAGAEVSCPQCNLPPEQRQVGMVFQDYALFPHLTVAENIAFGLTVQGSAARSAPQERSQTCAGRSPFPPSRLSLKQKIRSLFPHRMSLEHRQRTKVMLELVGLEGLEHRYPHQLSGGQQQRVALARALAPQPRLILLDEPLSNLDIQVRLHLRQELRQILKRAGITAVLVTHDQEEALAISDRIAVMYRGHLEQVGSPQRIYQDPASRFVAEFVTQANFLPLQRSGNGAQTEIGWINLPQDLPQDLPPVARSPIAPSPITPSPISPSPVAPVAPVAPTEGNGEFPLVLMVRQDDLILKPHPQGIAEVVDWEFLGREQRYYLRLPSGQCLKVRQPLSSGYGCGDRVSLEFSPQFCPVLFPALSVPFHCADGISLPIL